MLNIRLSRVGKKGHAQYRIVVAEKSSPVKGKSVEQIGNYDPHTKELVVKKDRVEYWIGNGAACSDTVKNLFIEKGVIKGDKVKLTFKKKEVEGEEADGDSKEQSTEKKEDKATDATADAKEADKKEEVKEDDKKDDAATEVDDKDKK